MTVSRCMNVLLLGIVKARTRLNVVSWSNSTFLANFDKPSALVLWLTPTISVSLFPKDAKYQTITWESSNKTVATVVDGNIKGLSTGKAVITASTINFKGETITSKCNVVVTDPDYISKRTLLYTYDDYINHNAAENDSCPVSGNARLLVVPVWFTNSDEFISLENREEIRNDIDLAFFGSDSDTGWKSLSNYYKEESIYSYDWYSLHRRPYVKGSDERGHD